MLLVDTTSVVARLGHAICVLPHIVSLAIPRATADKPHRWRGRAWRAQPAGTGPSSSGTRAAIDARTTAHTATATHTHTRAKSTIPRVLVSSPTMKLQAAYIPTGNTVDQRRTV